MNRVNLTVGLLCSVATAALSSAAVAQAQPAAVEEVVVTGSRVITNGNNSPTPVTVVPVEQVLRLQPTTVAEALNNLPIFSGSRGQLSNPNNGTAANNGGGNSSGNFLNLRNMGAVRTLILFDGHRVPPTSVNGVVDVDMIPQQLLQRVDVVTGGASAVYGSDAMTGVVNFITDRSFNGIKAHAQYGVTEKGDDVSYNAGVAAGMRLGERAHIEASYEYRNDNGVGWRSSRDPGLKIYSVQGLGTEAVPYYLTPDARVNNSTFGGLINLGVLNGQTFNQNGVLSPFVRGTASGTTGIEIGGNGVFFNTSLKSPLESHQLFGRLDYDLTDKVHAFVEVTGNDKENGAWTTWVNLNNVSLSSQNAFLATAYRNQLAAANQPTFRMSKQMIDTDRNHTINKERQVFFNAGLDGELGAGFKWNLGYVHSKARLVLSNSNINNGRLYAALDAVVNPANGQIVCNVTLTNPGLYQGCVPLNPFGPTSDDPAAIAYFLGRTNFTARTAMDDLSGSVSGSPFSTWAGPVNMAVSGEWRKVTYSGTSEATPSDLLNCTGLRFNCIATSTQWNGSIANRSEVSQTVKEGALEADVPLLKDAPFAESFNLNGAVRYTGYNTSGNYWTWKVGLDWHINDAIRLRGTRSRDIRAPTLDDLFAPTTVNNNNVFPDRLTNTNPTVPSETGGNPDLTAEVGDTWTAGLVFRPSAVPGLSLAIDYFNIKVSNAMLNLLNINPTWQRACYASGGSSLYCQLQIRPGGFTNTAPTNIPTRVFNRQINIAEQVTNGADFEVNYATRLFGRSASMRWLTTYQPDIKFIQPGVVTIDQAGAAFGTNGITQAAKWRVTAFFRVSPIEGLNVDVQTRWRSKLRLSGDPTHVISSGPVPSATFTNMNVSYQLKTGLGQGEVFLNVANVFDKAAPPAAFYGGQTIPGQQTAFVIGDDPLGRAFTVGVRLRR